MGGFIEEDISPAPPRAAKSFREEDPDRFRMQFDEEDTADLRRLQTAMGADDLAQVVRTAVTILGRAYSHDLEIEGYKTGGSRRRISGLWEDQ